MILAHLNKCSSCLCFGVLWATFSRALRKHLDLLEVKPQIPGESCHSSWAISIANKQVFVCGIEWSTRCHNWLRRCSEGLVLPFILPQPFWHYPLLRLSLSPLECCVCDLQLAIVGQFKSLQLAFPKDHRGGRGFIGQCHGCIEEDVVSMTHCGKEKKAGQVHIENIWAHPVLFRWKYSAL